MKMSQMSVLGFGFLLSLSAFGSIKKTYIETSMAPVPPQHLPDISAANMAQLKKHAKDVSSRMPASDLSVAEFETQNLSPKLIELRTKFLNIKSTDDIRAYLEELDRDYDTYPNDLKYIAAQLVLLRPFDGIVYRAANIFERSKVTHALALSRLDKIAASMEVFLPTDQWISLFNYTTIPTDKTGAQFGDVAQLQDFLMSDFNPALDKAITRLDALSKSMDKSFVFDRKFLYGPASYQYAADRFRQIGPAEVYATLASLSMGMHNLLVFCAYDQLDLPSVVEGVGHLYGKDAFMPDRLLGVSEKQYFQKVESYPSFLKLRPATRKDVPNSPRAHGFLDLLKSKFEALAGVVPSKDAGAYGRALMPLAFARLKDAIQYVDASWAVLQKESSDENMNSLRPGVYHAYSREGDFRLATWKGLIQGKMAVQSAMVPDQSVIVDLPAFYNSPVADLKDLLPTGFDSSPEFAHAPLTRGSVEYRNYLSGRPTQWNSTAYAQFVTGPNGEAPAHVEDAIRILHQAWGGAQTSLPLSFVVR